MSLVPAGPALWTQPARSVDWPALLAVVQDVSIVRLMYVTALKRALDVTVSAVMLLLLAPLLLAAMALIRLDSPGSAIFRQQRIGRGGRAFTIYKFRTMTADTSGIVRWMSDERGHASHKLRNDPRVTRIGRWLRRVSIDELPQLVNVLKGDMSLIGPRPELLEIVERYQPWQHERHIVRPGLTGWWQVSGRSEHAMHENTELDMYYIENISLGLDCRIMFKTVRVVVSGLGAF